MKWKLDSQPEERDGRGGWRGGDCEDRWEGRGEGEKNREVRRDAEGEGGGGGGDSSSEPSVSWVTDPEVQNTSAHVGIKVSQMLLLFLFAIIYSGKSSIIHQTASKHSSHCQLNKKLEELV